MTARQFEFELHVIYLDSLDRRTTYMAKFSSDDMFAAYKEAKEIGRDGLFISNPYNTLDPLAGFTFIPAHRIKKIQWEGFDND